MKHKLGLLLLMVCVAVSTGLGLSTESLADDDDEHEAYTQQRQASSEHEEHEHEEHEGRKSSKSSWRGQQASVLPVSNPTYARECAACHFAYLPGLLPAASWKHVMATLDDHFGDDASLDDPQTIAEISDFLQRFAADNSDARRSRQIMASLKDNNRAPNSITEIPYIRHKHREIPQRMIQGNKKVRSLSNCIACHDQADRGVFTEHGLKIPGFGDWDD